jgi:hypothetical protein
MIEQNYRIKIKKGDTEIDIAGDKNFVEKHIEKYKKEVFEPSKKISDEEISPIREGKKKESGLDEISLSEFYKKKKPKDYKKHDENILIFSYYLSEIEKNEEFSPKNIEDCYEETSIPKPSNTARDMKSLASGKKAYLIKSSRGIYKLSAIGKELVKNELPRKNEK